MNKYICKAKDIKTGEWIIGYYVQAKDYLYDKPMHIIFLLNECVAFPRNEFIEWYEVDPNTLCRCTNVTDQYGNLIFEHDILHGTMYHMFDACTETFEVHWLDEIGGWGFNYFEPSDCVIIGNTFDNKEMLNNEQPYL